jgi:hypothetical protein
LNIGDVDTKTAPTAERGTDAVTIRARATKEDITAPGTSALGACTHALGAIATRTLESC